MSKICIGFCIFRIGEGFAQFDPWLLLVWQQKLCIASLPNDFAGEGAQTSKKNYTGGKQHTLERRRWLHKWLRMAPVQPVALIAKLERGSGVDGVLSKLCYFTEQHRNCFWKGSRPDFELTGLQNSFSPKTPACEFVVFIFFHFLIPIWRWVDAYIAGALLQCFSVCLSSTVTPALYCAMTNHFFVLLCYLSTLVVWNTSLTQNKLNDVISY